MKLSGRPDDLSINHHAWNKDGVGFSEGVERFAASGWPTPVRAGAYMGGIITFHAEFDMSSTAVVQAGVNKELTIASTLEDGSFKNWMWLHAFVYVLGFTGGSGAVGITVGTTASTFDDLIVSSNASANNTTIFGSTPAHLGSLLSHTISGSPAFKPGMDLSSPGNRLVSNINNGSFSGTATGGRLIYHIIGTPLDWT